MNLPAGYGWPAERVRAWTTALDALAAAGGAAVVTFLELSVLAHIADLAAAAIERLNEPGRPPGPPAATSRLS